MAVLADALAAMGSFNESADLYQRIIECARTASATDPVSFISSLGDGLKYFDRAGRAAEGEATAREALAALSRFGGAHQDVAGAFESYLAHFVSMSGRVDEAEPLFVRLLANEESLPGPTLRARLQRFYAAHLSRRGLFQEAEGRLQRAVSIYGQAPKGVRDPVPDETLCGFIDLYKAWDRSDKVREFERLREERFGSSTRQ